MAPWLAVHYAAAILFPLMALVVWLLIRGLRGRAATVAGCALPVFAVFYAVWEAMFGIANGLLAQAGNDLSGAARQGAREASDAIVELADLRRGGRLRQRRRRSRGWSRSSPPSSRSSAPASAGRAGPARDRRDDDIHVPPFGPSRWSA